MGQGRVVGTPLPFGGTSCPCLCAPASSLPAPPKVLHSVCGVPASGCHHVCVCQSVTLRMCVRVCACTRMYVSVSCFLLGQDATAGSQPCLLQPQCLRLRERRWSWTPTTPGLQGQSSPDREVSLPPSSFHRVRLSAGWEWLPGLHGDSERGRLASTSLGSLPARESDKVPTRTFKLKPYIEKSLGI